MTEKKPRIKKIKPPSTETLGDKPFIPMPSLLDYKKTIVDIFTTPRTCWSPSSVKGALDQHDIGIFQSSGRLVDAMMRDPWIFACNNTLIYGVMGLQEGWKWREGYTPTKEDEDRLEITKAWWEQFMSTAVPSSLLKWVINMGFSVISKAWNLTDVNGQELYIPDVHVIHPSNVYYNTASRVYYCMTISHGVIVIEEEDPRIQLIKQMDSERAFYQGAVRPLGLVWIDKWSALSDWRAYVSIYGNPLRILTTDKEFSTPPEFDIELFIRNMQLAQQYGAPVHLMGPSSSTGKGGQKLELQQANSSNSDLFKDKIEQCNKEISLVYLGQNLTTDVKSGSFAAAKVHENVKADYIEAYTGTLNRALYKLVKEFYLFNFGSDIEVPSPFFNPAQPENELEIARIKSERAKGLQELSVALEKFSTTMYNGSPLINSINLNNLLEDYHANKE